MNHSQQTHTPSIFQLILSIIGLVASLLSMLALGAATFFSASFSEFSGFNPDEITFFLWITGAVTLLTIPSLILSIRNLAHQSLPNRNPRFFFAACICMVLAVPLAYLGYKLSSGNFPTSVRAILSILLIIIPLWGFIEFGRYQLFSGSPQRFWGMANFSVFVTLPIVILVEIAILIVAGGAGLLWLVKQPEFTPILMKLQTQITIDPTNLPDISGIVIPLIKKPEVIAFCVFLISVLIPLIEEFFKPLALWFFMKRNWSPAEGFTAGIICGAAFAFVESLASLSSASNETWIMLILGRMGTGLLHSLTAGLTGWALTSSWRDGKYLRIAAAYLGSVIIHGTWNFFALFFGFKSTFELQFSSGLTHLIDGSIYVLGVLFAAMAALLFFMNRKIKKETVPPLIPPQFIPTINENIE